MSEAESGNVRRILRTIAWRVAAVAILGGVGLLSVAAPASAHVRVDGGEQPAEGGYGLVRLIVPSEAKDASTVGLTLTVPAGVDLTSARIQPIPGWTATVEREAVGGGERVARVSWRVTDAANGLKGSEFGVFTLSAGPWPEDVGSVPLPTEQTYSDGSVVSWNEVALDAGSEPEHPAPVVALAAAGHGHGNDGHSDTATVVSAAGTAAYADESGAIMNTAAADNNSEVWVWRTIAGAALVIAVGAAGAVVALVRRSHAVRS
ncbi:DUF1775 domain-containing protein [Rhodococcus sp. YH1]|uniref:DUF1775 domain-containing protein n=1 Tax=Rhodococcus sp. YH1 TaxID=89066 RepID=UPI0013873969|nr:hypothetical protein [Rhodococcus sp. YH1]